MELNFAKRMENLKASQIREILKVTARPEVISFAGGLPAPELFPVESIMEVNRLVLEQEGQQALQYATTEGYDPLRDWCSARMNKRLKTDFGRDNILITHGSQQALDLLGKIFLDKGDIVLCESPTYLAAISAFKSYECEFIEVDTDEQGMIMADVEAILKGNLKVKLIYVIPEFQNPTGRTWSLERREQLAKLAAAYNVVVIEDNPYGELRFEGESLPAIKSFDTTGNVVCLGTFSKIFCPGYRIGWVGADERIIEKLVLIKQSTDLQCNTLAQRDIAKYLELFDIDAHIAKIRAVYKKRRDLAYATMKEAFPKEARFAKPEGGLFMWVELPGYLAGQEILEQCLEHNVAFVPGGPFFPNGGHDNTFRINFSNMPEDRIVQGLTIIGEVLRANVK